MFYGRENVWNVKPNTYLNSAKPGDSNRANFGEFLLFRKQKICPLHFSLEKLIDFEPKLAENYPHVRKNTLQKKNHKFDKNCERYLKISQSVPILLAPTFFFSIYVVV